MQAPWLPHPVVALSGCSYITAVENIKRVERPLYFPLSGEKLLKLKIGITHLQIYIESHPGRKKIFIQKKSPKITKKQLSTYKTRYGPL